MIEKPDKNILKKDFIRVLLTIVLFILLGFLVKFQLSLRTFLETQSSQNEQTEFTLESFVVDYKNPNEEKNDYRFQYTITFETAEGLELPDDWERSDELFSLYKDGRKVHFVNFEEPKEPFIPEVSNSKQVNPGEILSAEFEVRVNKKAKEVYEDVRFEVLIVVQELIGKRWTPVYQVHYMERGPYYSMIKTPLR